MSLVSALHVWKIHSIKEKPQKLINLVAYARTSPTNTPGTKIKKKRFYDKFLETETILFNLIFKKCCHFWSQDLKNTILRFFEFAPLSLQIVQAKKFNHKKLENCFDLIFFTFKKQKLRNFVFRSKNDCKIKKTI